MKRSLPFISLLTLSTAFISAPSLAEIYKWVDADGKIHYGDKQDDKTANTPDAAKAEVVELRPANAYESQAAMNSEKLKQDEEKEKQRLEDEAKTAEQNKAQPEAEAKTSAAKEEEKPVEEIKPPETRLRD